MPQVNALSAYWEAVPPPAAQLKRISLFLGLPDTKKTPPPAASTPNDAIREAMASGLPATEGRPNDPMLDLVGW